MLAGAMSETAERFRAWVEREFRFVETRGFRRISDGDRDTPVGAAVTYLGKHLGFLITLDVRDQVVDARVVRVRDGQVMDGGYACDLFVHLISHAGYRGGPSGTPAPERGADASRIERQVIGWANLLRTAGESLLADQEMALPG
jgi:hypothetical protein